jgi:glucosylceramidase
MNAISQRVNSMKHRIIDTTAGVVTTINTVLATTIWLVGLGVGSAGAQTVELVVSSKAGDRLATKPPIHFEAETQDRTAAFRIDAGATRGTMIGFGASFLEAGLMCLNSLPPADQESVLRALFDPIQGAGFTAMKTPLAGTDFMSAGPWYTYDDTPGDVALEHFSIDRDLGPNGLITYIHRARLYGSFILQAPMDYPPDWMLFDVNKNQDVNPKYYDALARYYLRYVQEYERHGVFIDYLSLFNEPGVYTKIPYPHILDLLKNHVGPLFEKAGVRTKLQLSEAPERGEAWQHYPIVLDDPAARQYVAMIVYHGYDWGHFADIAKLHQRYPDLPMWMTELCHAYEAGTPATMKLPRYDFTDGDYWGNVIMSDLEAGALGWTYWNSILDERGGPWAVSPVHGNPDPNIQQPVVIINRQTKKVTYTGLYYYLTHFSRFVRPGAVRLGVEGSHHRVRCVAFKSKEGRFVAQLINSRGTTAAVQLQARGKCARLTLPPISITTCLW